LWGAGGKGGGEGGGKTVVNIWFQEFQEKSVGRGGGGGGGEQDVLRGV